jgi:hypothetical protein
LVTPVRIFLAMLSHLKKAGFKNGIGCCRICAKFRSSRAFEHTVTMLTWFQILLNFTSSFPLPGQKKTFSCTFYKERKKWGGREE